MLLGSPCLPTQCQPTATTLQVGGQPSAGRKLPGGHVPSHTGLVYVQGYGHRHPESHTFHQPWLYETLCLHLSCTGVTLPIAPTIRIKRGRGYTIKITNSLIQPEGVSKRNRGGGHSHGSASQVCVCVCVRSQRDQAGTLRRAAPRVGNTKCKQKVSAFDAMCANWRCIFTAH